MQQQASDTFIKLQQLLELSLSEMALIFRLSTDDIKSLELGLLPFDYPNFKRRVFHLKELTDFLARQDKKQPVAKIFKTPHKELDNRSALDLLVSSRNDEAYYKISGVLYRAFK